MFENLEEKQERRRKRADTWMDQTFTCSLPSTLPNPFNLSLLQEAYIYSSQVKMEKNIELLHNIVISSGRAALAGNEQTT